MFFRQRIFKKITCLVYILKFISSLIASKQAWLSPENLFSGDNDACLNAIKELNEFQNMDQASDFLKNTLSKKHNWNSKSNQVKRLVNLVERRYQIK